MKIIKNFWDFPGGTLDKNPPANAGDTVSIPGPGRSHIPVEQLSPCVTTTEPVCAASTEARESRACAAQRKNPPQREAEHPSEE